MRIGLVFAEYTIVVDYMARRQYSFCFGSIRQFTTVPPLKAVPLRIEAHSLNDTIRYTIAILPEALQGRCALSAIE